MEIISNVPFVYQLSKVIGQGSPLVQLFLHRFLAFGNTAEQKKWPALQSASLSDTQFNYAQEGQDANRLQSQIREYEIVIPFIVNEIEAKATANGKHRKVLSLQIRVYFAQFLIVRNLK